MLTKSLISKCYKAGFKGLEKGAALEVEDLSATLKVVRYFIPLPYKLEAVRRIVRNLITRNIQFELTETLKDIKYFGSNHRILLKVKNREILFEIKPA